MTEQTGQRRGSHEIYIFVDARLDTDNLEQLLSQSGLDETRSLSKSLLAVTASTLEGATFQVVAQTVEQWLSLEPPRQFRPSVMVVQYPDATGGLTRVFTIRPTESEELKKIDLLLEMLRPQETGSRLDTAVTPPQLAHFLEADPSPLRNNMQALAEAAQQFREASRGEMTLGNGPFDGPFRPLVEATVPISVYLGNGEDHEQVIAAVEVLLDELGLKIAERTPPMIGSFYQSFKAKLKVWAHTPAGQAALSAAAAAADARSQQWSTENTEKLLGSVGPIITALESEEHAVIRVGVILIVKTPAGLTINHLSKEQVLVLDNRPALTKSPDTILEELGIPHRGQDPDDLTAIA